MKIKFFFWINTFFSVLYLFWRIFFTIPFRAGALSVVCGIILLIFEALGMVEAFVHFTNMNTDHNYKVPDVPKERFPHIDVYISTYSEEPELLYKTINGCKNMDYPDKSKVHVYLCDDNRRPEMEELAKKMGVNYLKRANNIGAKAGNLNHALAHSTSPYVVTFDADMIPQKRFLMQLVPYLVDAEMKNEGKSEEEKVKIGFIQSPQNFTILICSSSIFSRRTEFRTSRIISTRIFRLPEPRVTVLFTVVQILLLQGKLLRALEDSIQRLLQRTLLQVS